LRTVLQTPEWQSALAQLRGHDPDASGEVLSLRRVLPWWTYRRAKG
jgi:putative molybdopterin biosynthesis protein